jgi:hypothetical protein
MHCDLCVNRLPEGVSGCRAEFYTNERSKKCGITVSEPQRSCTQRAWAPPVTMRPGREKESREKESLAGERECVCECVCLTAAFTRARGQMARQKL